MESVERLMALANYLEKHTLTSGVGTTLDRAMRHVAWFRLESPAFRRGEVQKGINHYARKVPKDIILEIARSTAPIKDIIAQYKLDRTTIRKYRKYTNQQLIIFE